jgi:mRNA-degrading endonuclease RelE of RelBE toxin-antitoxin system
MIFKYHKDFDKSFKKLPVFVKKKFFVKIKLFIQNRNHPSLNLEKLELKILNKSSLRIDKRYRVIFEFQNHETIFFLDIGSHDQIYKRTR